MRMSIAPDFTIWHHCNEFFKEEGGVISPIQRNELQKVYDERVSQAKANSRKQSIDASEVAEVANVTTDEVLQAAFSHGIKHFKEMATTSPESLQRAVITTAVRGR